MKKSNRKGFTVVELVIVIAVIAILAAVLIPTFASIIKKANLSSDQSAVRNMNTALAAETEVLTIDDATRVLSEAGYNADKTLVPVTKGHSFYWYETYNTILLIDDTDGKFELVYPTNNEDIVANYKDDKALLHNLAFSRSKTEVKSNEIADVLKAGNNVSLTEEIKVTDAKKVTVSGKSVKTNIVVPAGESVNIDLNNNKVSAADGIYAIAIGGNAYIDNGTISSRGLYICPGATVTLGKNVKVEANGADGGSAIRNFGGVLIINGGEYSVLDAKDLAEVNSSTIAAQPSALYCDGGYVEINGGKFIGNDTKAYAVNINNASVVINNCEVTSGRGAISLINCAAEINGGNFTNDFNGSAYTLYYNADVLTASLKITGGTFTNKNTGSGAYEAYIAYTSDIAANINIDSSVLAKANGNYYNSAK